MIIPTIHLNGTAARAILEEHTIAMDAVQDALDKIPHPNGRDYYPQGPAAIGAAIDQSNVWRAKLNEVFEEIQAVTIEIMKEVK